MRDGKCGELRLLYGRLQRFAALGPLGLRRGVDLPRQWRNALVPVQGLSSASAANEGPPVSTLGPALPSRVCDATMVLSTPGVACEDAVSGCGPPDAWYPPCGWPPGAPSRAWGKSRVDAGRHLACEGEPQPRRPRHGQHAGLLVSTIRSTRRQAMFMAIYIYRPLTSSLATHSERFYSSHFGNFPRKIQLQ